MKTVAIMCAYNELSGKVSYLENSINSVIDCLDEGLFSHSIFVDDGSTDGTFEFVKSMIKNYPIEVLRCNTNLGKAKAFLKGLKESARYNPEVIVTLDSDMINFSPKHAKKMLEKLDCATNMVLGAYKHMCTSGPSPIHVIPEYTGIRAIKFNSLTEILDPDNKEYAFWRSLFDYEEPHKGYRLEKILNELIPD